MSNRNIGPHSFEELLLNLTLVVDVLDSLTQAPVSVSAPRVGVLTEWRLILYREYFHLWQKAFFLL